MEDKITLPCSWKEFNIRWWGWGLTATIGGIIIGYIIWGL